VRGFIQKKKTCGGKAAKKPIKKYEKTEEVRSTIQGGSWNIKGKQGGNRQKGRGAFRTQALCQFP